MEILVRVNYFNFLYVKLLRGCKIVKPSQLKLFGFMSQKSIDGVVSRFHDNFKDSYARLRLFTRNCCLFFNSKFHIKKIERGGNKWFLNFNV